MIVIDHPEKTGEGEVALHDLINLGGQRWRRFIHGLPFWKDDRNLNKGRCIDIKIDPCLRGRGEDRKKR